MVMEVEYQHIMQKKRTSLKSVKIIWDGEKGTKSSRDRNWEKRGKMAEVQQHQQRNHFLLTSKFFLCAIGKNAIW